MPFSDDERRAFKEAVKEALKEWLDAKYAEFGRWSFYGISAAVLSTLGYFIIVASGWHR